MRRCQGRWNLAGRVVSAVPGVERTLSVARTFGIGRMLALWSGDAVFRDVAFFASPPLAFEAAHRWTSPTHCPLSSCM
ncbi:hypothetical protein GCM10007920_29990 [Ciceribacter naphthalenivorans]|uniref:Uncharacterized protein n=2 Tax=Alphaproteobacteria TaxID=28211 RepID=A0A512HPX0_9HYPH|nr:hypothetical protein RNA01_44360 [Ciceribacter naphthalenivorans]GLR23211.1 hypothetical protein GCM10007920_29990 [Ciceribacter naphthalenivorans]GLT06067.1 hypothetical protein GCM10007926_29990 [Sphingomonas psychrolutea]